VAIGRLEPERFAQVLATRTEDHDPISSLCLATTDVLSVSGAGLLLMSKGRSLACVGVSDAATEVVEQLEFTLGEGPCVDAYQRKAPVFDPDLGDVKTERWPEFRRGAMAAGIRAAFGFPLLVDSVCIGALNLYRTRPGALTDRQIGDALVVADIVGRTLLRWQADAAPGTVAWQLEEVPKHGIEIHQASGRISVQAGVSLADAVVLLRAYAFANDRPIGDIAHEVASGALRFDGPDQ
jgi:GAF domain-containing protein